ncbi:hypothetical protein ACVWXO_000530 [Bradyrhizobium sp. LM2.7]
MASQLDLLDQDARTYAANEKVDPDAFALLNMALKGLKEVAAGKPISRVGGPGAWREAKHDDDNDLFFRFKAAINLNLHWCRTPDYARTLRRFSDWLYDQQKESVSRRLYSDELMKDAKRFEALSYTLTRVAVRSLRNWHP